MLTGKCKEKFDKWLTSNTDYQHVIIKAFGDHISYIDILLHEKTPIQIQWGVIQDFADSVGIYIDVIGHHSKGYSIYEESPVKDHLLLDVKSNRHQSRIYAIEKFNELYNSKN